MKIYKRVLHFQSSSGETGCAPSNAANDVNPPRVLSAKSILEENEKTNGIPEEPVREVRPPIYFRFSH